MLAGVVGAHPLGAQALHPVVGRVSRRMPFETTTESKSLLRSLGLFNSTEPALIR